MFFDSYVPWFEECRAAVDSDYDDIHLFTGEEGRGKSRAMRQVFARLDAHGDFSVDRIHFSQDEFLDQAVTLPRGSSIILDEFRGHKRLAMHGDRLEFLDFTKECRGLNLHIGIGYPHVTQMEGDILYQRVRWWNHIPARGRLEVHRRVSSTRIGRDGKPVIDVRFPMAGKLPLPANAPDPLGKEYEVKKEARMRDRAARYREAHGGEREAPIDPARPRFVDLEAVRAALRP